VVFTRYPAAGRVKTRLIAAVGALGAAEVQRRMTEQTLATAASVPASTADVEVCYTGGSRRQMRRWLGGAMAMAGQGTGDLGERMRRAFDRGFDEGCRHVVIIGADCPSITADDLTEAIAALEECDMVLGPCGDGGYWLIALRRRAEVLAGIEWGGPSVLSATLGRAKEAGLAAGTLTEKQDIDEPGDLDCLPWVEAARRPYLSVIVPALNEQATIQQAVASARGEGVEVVVVDGGSDDATAELAAQAGARVLRTSPGRAVQMNSGAAAARGRVLLFLHADTLLPAGYGEAVFEAMLDPKVVGGALGFSTDEGGWAMRVVTALVAFRADKLHLPYGDQGVFVRRSVFESLGGYRDWPVGEDLDFAARLRLCGRVAVMPAAARTSGRRWRELGVWRTMLINQIVVAAYWLGASPGALRWLYTWPRRRRLARRCGGSL